MNRTQTALKIRGQISKFMGIFYPHFSAPKLKFIEQMVFGLQASKDVKLSNISRSLDEGISLKKTEERLSRNLDTPGLDNAINSEIAKAASRRVHKDTLIIIDPSDIRKNYAEAMPFLGRVRDGSTGQLVNGYWSCLAVACEVGKRRMLLTTREVTKSRKSLWFVVEGYISRWLVEDAIRFIKQSYKLEDIRVLSYQRLKNMMALVLAAVYFSAAWLGESIKLAVLTAHAIKASKRFFGVTEFHYYALADGIALLLSRIRAARISHQQETPQNEAQTFLPGFS